MNTSPTPSSGTESQEPPLSISCFDQGVEPLTGPRSGGHTRSHKLSANDLRPDTAFYANQPAYRALIDAVCNEYGRAVSVDLAPGWDNTTMVSVLDATRRFHPNTLGMACIADNFERAIKTALETGDPGLR